jgi:predicted GNAT family acetyltransferase
MKFFRKGPRPSELIQNFFADQHRSLHHVPVSRFTLDPLKALIIQSKLPGEVYVTNLQRSHAHLVHHHWIPKVQTSIEDVADDIDHLQSAGVFLKENDQLVSWVVTSFVDGFSKLHTLEQYRHRGYATLAVKYLAKQLARSGLVPFVYIVADNEISIKLFQNVGFQFQCESHIVKLFAK